MFFRLKIDAGSYYLTSIFFEHLLRRPTPIVRRTLLTIFRVYLYSYLRKTKFTLLKFLGIIQLAQVRKTVFYWKKATVEAEYI